MCLVVVLNVGGEMCEEEREISDQSLYISHLEAGWLSRYLDGL